jgi:hypothetical protein
MVAPDLGVFINGEDFIATQEMSEECRQEITYNGAFGFDGPILRRVRFADEGTVTFSAIILKSGQARGMNNEDKLKNMRDFEIVSRRGSDRHVYRGCNWSRIAVRSTLDQVTIDVDVSIPGYTR